MMTRSERNSRRWIWSLAAGLLLVPVMSVGAIASTSTDVDRSVHEKEARGAGHTHVGIEDAAEHKAYHDLRSGIDHDDHPVFDTTAEHKAYHDLRSGIDHDDHPVFDTPAEHKAYHDIIARFVRDGSARDDVTSSDQPESQERNADGDADAGELKEQPVDRTEAKSTDQDSSTDHTRDRSERNQESREEPTN